MRTLNEPFQLIGCGRNESQVPQVSVTPCKKATCWKVSECSRRVAAIPDPALPSLWPWSVEEKKFEQFEQHVFFAGSEADSH